MNQINVGESKIDFPLEHNSGVEQPIEQFEDGGTGGRFAGVVAALLREETANFTQVDVEILGVDVENLANLNHLFFQFAEAVGGTIEIGIAQFSGLHAANYLGFHKLSNQFHQGQQKGHESSFGARV